MSGTCRRSRTLCSNNLFRMLERRRAQPPSGVAGSREARLLAAEGDPENAVEHSRLPA